MHNQNSSNSVDLTKALELAKRLAIDAASIIQRMRVSGDLSIRYKSGFDPVTSADTAAEEFIVKEILREYPDHKILAEESSNTFLNRNDWLCPLWVIDPIDGTTNYAHDHHQVAISIALAIEGIVQLGVVHAPFQNETFTAIKSRGAFLNGKRISASEKKELSSALLGMGQPSSNQDVHEYLRMMHSVLELCHDYRRIGSGALDICWVGAGRFDGFHETLSPWDLAAGCLIAREAGAITGHLLGVPAEVGTPKDLYGGYLLVANRHLYPKLERMFLDAIKQKTT